MRNKRTWTIMCIFAPILSLVLSTYFNIEKIPEIIFVREDSSLKSSYLVKLSENKETSTAVDSTQAKARVKNVKVKLLGILPVKSVSVRSVPEISIYPGGISVGVKLNTKGVLVVALSDIETNKGKSISPAASSGIAIGDSILTVNGVPVENSEMLVREINNNESKTIEFEIERKGQRIIKKVTPIKSIKEDKFKIGLWVRDSTAGVGTLTFYDEKTKKFAALGHPVTDVDTGTILNVNTGEVVSSSIVSIRKGMKGNPGELKGIFVNEDTILGTVTKNTECGIFGSANEQIINNIYTRHNKPMKVGLRNEIKEGKAQIITTIDENGPKAYDIEIVKLLNQETPGPKSMVIKVTDSNLLEKTGGIVQGMSGSPIIQNDKIVGAVTHVLINKPDTGYGIYIEWMLKDSDILTKQ